MASKTAHATLIGVALIGATIITGLTGWWIGKNLLPNDASAALDRNEPELPLSKYPAANREAKTDRALPETVSNGEINIDMTSPSLETARNYILYPVTHPGFPSTTSTEQARSEKQSRLMLSDAQIDSIKKRLKLTSAQEKLWPPVESALRSVMVQIYEFQKRSMHGYDSFDVNSTEIQRLKQMTAQLMAKLREEQKNEIFLLVKMAGLGSFLSDLRLEPIAKSEN